MSININTFIDENQITQLKQSQTFWKATPAQRKYFLENANSNLFSTYIQLGALNEYIQLVFDELDKINPIVKPIATPPTNERYHNPWFIIGKLEDFDIHKNQKPLTEYEYAIVYNSINPRPISVITWNKGLRVVFNDPYVMGDNVNSFKYGSCGFYKGVDGLPDTQNWYQYYHHLNQDGDFTKLNTNGISNGIIVYARHL